MFTNPESESRFHDNHPKLFSLSMARTGPPGTRKRQIMSAEFDTSQHALHDDYLETRSTISELSLAGTLRIDDNEFSSSSDESTMSFGVTGHAAERQKSRSIHDSELIQAKKEGTIRLAFDFGASSKMRSQEDALSAAQLWSQKLRERFSDSMIIRQPELKRKLDPNVERFEVKLCQGKEPYSTRAVKKFLSAGNFFLDWENKILYQVHDLVVVEGGAAGKSKFITSYKNEKIRGPENLESQLWQVLEPFEFLEEGHDWSHTAAVKKEHIVNLINFVRKLAGNEERFRRSMQAAGTYGLVPVQAVTSRADTAQLSNLKFFQEAVVKKWNEKDERRGPYSTYCGGDKPANERHCLKYFLFKAVQSAVEKRVSRTCFLVTALAYLANWSWSKHNQIVWKDSMLFVRSSLRSPEL